MYAMVRDEINNALERRGLPPLSPRNLGSAFCRQAQVSRYEMPGASIRSLLCLKSEGKPSNPKAAASRRSSKQCHAQLASPPNTRLSLAGLG
jgi:hypothetical protein